jgi:hypothetical protein
LEALRRDVARLDAGPRELATRRLRQLEALDEDARLQAARQLQKAVALETERLAEASAREHQAHAATVFGRDHLVLSAEARAHFA